MRKIRRPKKIVYGRIGWTKNGAGRYVPAFQSLFNISSPWLAHTPAEARAVSKWFMRAARYMEQNKK